MNGRTLAKAFTALLPLSGLAGCGLFSGDDVGPARVSEMVSWAERVYVDSELARDKAHAAVDKLQAIVASEYEGNAVAAYVEFVEAVEQSERQAEKLRASVEPMKEAAEDVFEQWSADLEAFSSARMRQRSRERLAETRERYEKILDAAEPAMTAYDEINRGLRDHALFLGHDLNAASVDAIREDVRGLAELVDGFDGRLDTCLAATREYVRSAALPMAAAPSAAPPGGSRAGRDRSLPPEQPREGPPEGPREQRGSERR